MAFNRFWRLSRPISNKQEEQVSSHKSHPIVLLGFHRGAKAMVDTIVLQHPELLKQLLVVDFNLETLDQLKTMQIEGVFGDITSVDTLEHAHIDEAKIIISTIPDMLLRGTNNLKLVRTCRTLAPDATIIATADLVTQVDELKAAGANEVILPYVLEGRHLATTVSKLSRELFAHNHSLAKA